MGVVSKRDFIKKELADLDVQVGSQAYNFILYEAMEAAEILSYTELSRLIEEHLENFSLQQRGL